MDASQAGAGNQDEEEPTLQGVSKIINANDTISRRNAHTCCQSYISVSEFKKKRMPKKVGGH